MTTIDKNLMDDLDGEFEPEVGNFTDHSILYPLGIVTEDTRIEYIEPPKPNLVEQAAVFIKEIEDAHVKIRGVIDKLPAKVVMQSESTDLFGVPLPTPPVIESFTTSPALVGADIIRIRELTGKRRDNAMAALNQLTVEMFDAASPDCFYIPGNVASSKNSKEIGFYLKKDPITGKMNKINILVDSKLTKEYKKNTAGYWLQNKVAFLNQVRHLPIPITVELTFIRDSLRGYDFINAAQVLMDLMGSKNGYGWIPDDDSCQIVPVFNPITYYHQKMAGVLIRVIK